MGRLTTPISPVEDVGEDVQGVQLGIEAHLEHREASLPLTGRGGMPRRPLQPVDEPLHLIVQLTPLA
ncbi:hypothetical protein, partial [Halomonas sp. BM-2019]|uniref:hypothetical protein n=1 Tax=Halomonas sp. BM-2019 TaxID=2811227 RepID=UPI001B3C1E2D